MPQAVNILTYWVSTHNSVSHVHKPHHFRVKFYFETGPVNLEPTPIIAPEQTNRKRQETHVDRHIWDRFLVVLQELFCQASNGSATCIIYGWKITTCWMLLQRWWFSHQKKINEIPWKAKYDGKWSFFRFFLVICPYQRGSGSVFYYMVELKLKRVCSCNDCPTYCWQARICAAGLQMDILAIAWKLEIKNPLIIPLNLQSVLPFPWKGTNLCRLGLGWKLKQRQLTSRRGENRASGCERFEKMSFSQQRNYWFIPQHRLKILRDFGVHVW